MHFPQSFLKLTGNDELGPVCGTTPADVAGAVLGAVLEQEPSEWIFEESFVKEMGLAFPE